MVMFRIAFCHHKFLSIFRRSELHLHRATFLECAAVKKSNHFHQMQMNDGTVALGQWDKGSFISLVRPAGYIGRPAYLPNIAYCMVEFPENKFAKINKLWSEKSVRFKLSLISQIRKMTLGNLRFAWACLHIIPNSPNFRLVKFSGPIRVGHAKDITDL